MAARQIMAKLKLTINETKTRVCRLPEESFDFLGYSIGRCYSTKTGKAYLGTTPSKNECNASVEKSAKPRGFNVPSRMHKQW